MISVDEAFSILNKITFIPKVIEVTLLDSLDYVLAETQFSPIDMPPFRQATMDGFALSIHDSPDYEIIGEVKAGDFFKKKLKKGQAVKIFTGAAVPASADVVIQIEKVSVVNSKLTLQEIPIPETNIRQKGAQISKNDIALEKGKTLNPAAIGFLSGLGLTKVKVYQKPKVGIMVTGNELVSAGSYLPKGKIFESNSVMLQTVLIDKNFNAISLYQVIDDLENTKLILKKALSDNDVIIITGGISVGDYDFVGKALDLLSVEKLFYKVNQKPGKPLFVGMKKDKMIFALPGNPAASLTCFYVYVLPTIQRISGSKVNYGSQTKKCLAHDFQVDNIRSQFLKATIFNDEVKIHSHQDSAMLNTFALANAMVYVPNGNYKLNKGEKVFVYPI